MIMFNDDNVERPNFLSRWIHVIMRNENNVKGPNFLSNELRYINWENYPASPFLESFQPTNLVVLKMMNSFQKELWRSHKVIRWFPNIWVDPIIFSFKSDINILIQLFTRGIDYWYSFINYIR